MKFELGLAGVRFSFLAPAKTIEILGGGVAGKQSTDTGLIPKRESQFDVFISYRRESGADVAGRIQQALINRKIRVFLDTDDIKKGYFRSVIVERIRRTPNFLIVLSPGALDRCQNEDDVLRKEVEEARHTNRNIIPILLDNFGKPNIKLPDEVADVLQLHALSYDHKYFRSLIDEIIALISRHADNRKRARRIRSLAVLPFLNEQPDENVEYLCEGITESLINILSQLPKLRTMARGTVFRYKNTANDPQSAGRELGVDGVLFGRIRDQSGILKLSVELIDVEDGAQIWGKRYAPNVDDVSDVEQQIARDISDELRPRLEVKRKKVLFRKYTQNAEAYHFYLKGRYYWNKRTSAGLRKSLEQFQLAINLDNDYALAYAGLSDCYQLLGGYRILPPADAFAKAKNAAGKALKIDRNLAEAHTSLALANLYFDWNWTKAEREIKLAIRLNPNYPTAHQWYTHYLMAMGRPVEALASIQHAHRLDPLSLVINTHWGWALYFVRDFEASREQLAKTLELEPNYTLARFVSGMSYVGLQRFSDAVADLELAASLSERLPSIVSALGYAYGLMKKDLEATKILEELKVASAVRYVSAYDVALVYLGLREIDTTIEWLERAFKERSSWMVWLKAEPVFDALRCDMRFQEIVARVGVP